MRRILLIIFVVSLFVSCDATKKLPTGTYLLDKFEVETDTKELHESSIKSLVIQRPNSSLPILGKYRVGIYNLAGEKSGWFNKQIRKMGEAPVIYNKRMTELSRQEITYGLQNKGYLNAVVDTSTVYDGRKVKVNYKVNGGIPYRIESLSSMVRDTTIFNLLTQGKNRLKVIERNDLFDLKVLDDGQISMASYLRENGYFNFSKENFYYVADTTVGDNRVKLIVGLKLQNDSLPNRQSYIRNVKVYNGFSFSDQNDDEQQEADLDSVDVKGVTMISKNRSFMRHQAIYYNNFIRPGHLYSDRAVENSYASLSRLGAINQVEIKLNPVIEQDSSYIDVGISILPANRHWSQIGFEGTNSAGDLGLATTFTYENRNIFKGSERFRFKLKGAYEFINSDKTNLSLYEQNYYEYGSEVFLEIPQLLLPVILQKLKEQTSASTNFSAGINIQKRQEYSRQFFNLSSRLQWRRMNWHLSHVVEPIDINYVRMPWVSDFFKKYYLDNHNNYILRYSYDDQLIARTTYTVTYTNSASRKKAFNPFHLKFGIDVAGLLPRLIKGIGLSSINKDGFHEVMGIRYAEYFKFDFDYAKTFVLKDNNSLAWHIAFGIATPYGNSRVLPFETRYFGGGANSVRGWSTRSLGPGSYALDFSMSNFAHKTGDVKLDLSLEYRLKMTSLFEFATFLDAGNIWTIKEYPNQEGGVFAFNSFYKEIASSYGLGIRLDLDFLLIRFDAGMKIYDPANEIGRRFVLLQPNFRKNFAFHFAIGYPF